MNESINKSISPDPDEKATIRWTVWVLNKNFCKIIQFQFCAFWTAAGLFLCKVTKQQQTFLCFYSDYVLLFSPKCCNFWLSLILTFLRRFWLITILKSALLYLLKESWRCHHGSIFMLSFILKFLVIPVLCRLYDSSIMYILLVLFVEYFINLYLYFVCLCLFLLQHNRFLEFWFYWKLLKFMLF